MVLVSSAGVASRLSSILVLISYMKNDITSQLERFLMAHLFVEQLLKIHVLFIQCSPNTCTLPTYSNRTFLTFNEKYIHSGMRKCVSFWDQRYLIMSCEILTPHNYVHAPLVRSHYEMLKTLIHTFSYSRSSFLV